MMDLVQVHATRYAPNTFIPSNLLSECDLVLTCGPSGETQAHTHRVDIDWLKRTAIEADLETRLGNILAGNAPELRWPQFEIMLLDFSFFGQAFGNDYTSGTEWDMREGNGVAHDMAEIADHLWAISAKLLDEYNLARGVALQQVRWVAVFSSHSSRPDENGECDNGHEFCGRLDLNLLTEVDVPSLLRAASVK
jgi:hypothetical protein